MGRLKLQTLKIYAYHGCFKEETKIGGEYHLDVWMEADFSDSEKSDELSKTIDYVEVADLAAQEMKIPSKLIEHVANRILVKMLSNWKFLKKAGVSIKKISPPMNQFVEAVEYSLERTQ
tara:strand:- start:97 stop:453 length:357 start_codon:yes stop_codon:yes gene_type:complete